MSEATPTPIKTDNSGTYIWLLIVVLAGGFLAFRQSQGQMANVYVKDVDGQQVITDAGDKIAGVARVSAIHTIGVWVSALMTLFILSFLYKDNPFYKFAEAVVVGVSAAYWMVIGFWTVIVDNLLGPLFPSTIQDWARPGLTPVRPTGAEEIFAAWWWNIIPLILGVMLLWRLMPAGAWISRWPLAFIIGTTAGMRMLGFLHADFYSQIENSIIPFVVSTGDGVDLWASVRNTLLILGVMCCIVYFFFSVEHKGAVGKVSRVGIWVLMITFGAAFGYTVMGRIALLAIRFEFLSDDWLWIIDPAGERLGM